jgi:hypothetical protein
MGKIDFPISLLRLVQLVEEWIGVKVMNKTVYNEKRDAK